MTDILDSLAELPGSAQNLPVPVRPPRWAAEKVTTFIGRDGRTLMVVQPARLVPAEDPFPQSFREQFVSAFRTRDALLVWELVERAGVR